MLRIVSAMAFGMAFAGPAAADVDLPAATACFDAGGAWSKQAIACIETAHLPCLSNAMETPAVATLCFQKARCLSNAAAGSYMSVYFKSTEFSERQDK